MEGSALNYHRRCSVSELTAMRLTRNVGLRISMCEFLTHSRYNNLRKIFPKVNRKSRHSPWHSICTTESFCIGIHQTATYKENTTSSTQSLRNCSVASCTCDLRCFPQLPSTNKHNSVHILVSHPLWIPEKLIRAYPPVLETKIPRSKSKGIVGTYNASASSFFRVNVEETRSEAPITVSKSKGIVRMYNAGVNSLVRSWRPMVGIRLRNIFRVFDRHHNGQGFMPPQLRSGRISLRLLTPCHCIMGPMFSVRMNGNPCVAHPTHHRWSWTPGANEGAGRLRACLRPCRR